MLQSIAISCVFINDIISEYLYNAITLTLGLISSLVCHLSWYERFVHYH